MTYSAETDPNPWKSPPVPPEMPGDPQPTMRERMRRAALRTIGPVYRPASAGMHPPRSILLIRPDHLGDMLFLTPALHALRAALPDAQIALLAGPWSAAILRGNPDVDLVRVCDFPGFTRQTRRSIWAPYAYLWQMARELRSSRFDVAVVLRHDHWWGAWLAAAAGIPRRIGYDCPETRPFLTEALPYQTARHEVEQNGTLLATLAPTARWEFGPLRFTPGDEDRAWAATWLTEQSADGAGPIVAIHPGAGARVKQWLPAYWAHVADRLIAMWNARILLTGSESERSLTQAIAGSMQHPVIDAAGQTDLGQLASLQAASALVMGPDCGPLHLAVAMGTPSIHLYGPAAVDKYGPWGDRERHMVLRPRWPCAPCGRLDWPAEMLPAHRCVESILPEEVLAVAERQLLQLNGS